MGRTVSGLLNFLRTWEHGLLIALIIVAIGGVIIGVVFAWAEENTPAHMPSWVDDLPEGIPPYEWVKSFFLGMFFITAALFAFFSRRLGLALSTLLVALLIGVGLAGEIRDNFQVVLLLAPGFLFLGVWTVITRLRLRKYMRDLKRR